jgi:hypothetical protein
MLAFLEELRKVHGSVEEYLFNEVGLTKDEIEGVKKTMVVNQLVN